MSPADIQYNRELRRCHSSRDDEVHRGRVGCWEGYYVEETRMKEDKRDLSRHVCNMRVILGYRDTRERELSLL